MQLAHTASAFCQLILCFFSFFNLSFKILFSFFVWSRSCWIPWDLPNSVAAENSEFKFLLVIFILPVETSAVGIWNGKAFSIARALPRFFIISSTDLLSFINRASLLMKGISPIFVSFWKTAGTVSFRTHFLVLSIWKISAANPFVIVGASIILKSQLISSSTDIPRSLNDIMEYKKYLLSIVRQLVTNKHTTSVQELLIIQQSLSHKGEAMIHRYNYSTRSTAGKIPAISGFSRRWS